MIQVVFHHQTDLASPIDGYRIYGHANYAEKGQDIVCAAVSILSVTITDELEAPVIESHSDNTLGVTQFKDCSENNVLINALEHGLRSMERDYGGFIAVNDATGGW
ncbi:MULTISPECIES: ribosomal-processing cysteine protease Prp [Lapidilactobacillus]|uniref:Ribosomal processing cysteine protease Prp n=2 Tax=Lapidilactobacillus TaxID=2767884 RepID=A0ABW1UQM6_9LACO|nr:MULTISPECIES: ribosomal-processing cysteine protease Prp [Lapidilactobacillus]